MGRRKFGDNCSFKPSKISDVPAKEAFIMRRHQLIKSRAMRGLSAHAHSALLCLEDRHCQLAGKENGWLAVTYQNFVEWGIPRRRIKRTIDELVAAKLLVIERRGRSRAGDGTPSLYRLTYLKSKFVPVAGSPYYLDPSSDWQKHGLGPADIGVFMLPKKRISQPPRRILSQRPRVILSGDGA